MANAAYGSFVFGLRDLKVTNLAGTLQEDLLGGQELSFKPEFRGGEQYGDDRLLSVISFIVGGTADVTAGALSSAAMAIMFGRTLTVGGTSPNETTTMKLSAGDNMPYFKLYGQSVSENGDGLHVLLAKCKVMSGGAVEMRENGFYSPSFSLRVVDDGTNGVARIIQNETATSLPTS